MQFGDVQGKGKVYSDTGKIILTRGEKIVNNAPGMLYRGWVRYKLGWRTIMFKGYGAFTLTNNRIVYVEAPEFIEKIHTFNLDHELGDFGGWDYHAHRMRRAAALDAFMFFELPYNEITEIKHKKEKSTIFIADAKKKYKIIVEQNIAQVLEGVMKKL
jgi:hypothetical protein